MSEVTRLPTAAPDPVKNPGPAIRDEGNVEIMSFTTRVDLPVERVLTFAQDAKLANAVVIGWDADGEFYLASTYAAGPEVLWLLELARKRLMEGSD
jgi:hypothetical protein